MNNKVDSPGFLDSIGDLEEATRDCSLVIKKVFNGEDQRENLSVAHKVKEAISSLDNELHTVLREKYGFSDGDNKSISDVANKLGTTEDAIDSLHQNALRALYSKPKR